MKSGAVMMNLSAILMLLAAAHSRFVPGPKDSLVENQGQSHIVFQDQVLLNQAAQKGVISVEDLILRKKRKSNKRRVIEDEAIFKQNQDAEVVIEDDAIFRKKREAEGTIGKGGVIILRGKKRITKAAKAVIEDIIATRDKEENFQGIIGTDMAEMRKKRKALKIKK